MNHCEVCYAPGRYLICRACQLEIEGWLDCTPKQVNEAVARTEARLRLLTRVRNGMGKGWARAGAQ